MPANRWALHQSPKRYEVKACRPWLEAELEAVKPKLVVALGATAAQSLLGASFKLTPNRGKLVAADIAPHVIATVHPSSILRACGDRLSLAYFVRIDGNRVIAATLQVNTTIRRLIRGGDYRKVEDHIWFATRTLRSLPPTGERLRRSDPQSWR